jgi:hypothetical protein
MQRERGQAGTERDGSSSNVRLRRHPLRQVDSQISAVRKFNRLNLTIKLL